MTVLNLDSYKPVADTEADADQIANGFTAIEGVVNGGLGRDNIAAGVIGAQTSTTVAGIGTAHGGDIALIRAGSTPFDFAALVYDATYSKWVGPAVPAASLGSSVAQSSSNVIRARGVLLPWRVMDTAGLKLQLRVLGPMNASAASTVFASAMVSTGDAGGALTDDTTNVTGEVSTTSTSAILKDSGWTQINASVTVKDFVLVSLGGKYTGSGGSLGIGVTVLYRWST